MKLLEAFRMLKHTLQFYANEDNYKLGGSRSVAVDRGQRAREILQITDAAETQENK